METGDAETEATENIFKSSIRRERRGSGFGGVVGRQGENMRRGRRGGGGVWGWKG